MKLHLDFVHNSSLGNLASVWITYPEFFEHKSPWPPWGAPNLDQVKDATRVVGPTTPEIALQVFQNLRTAFRALGHDVVSDEDDEN